MITEETIMEEMLGRATNPATDSVDLLAMQMFCMVVKSNATYVAKAQEMLLEKIRSTNVVESTRAIALLEDCMSNCGADFQEEAAKFRFLNGLIRLVSQKYHGAETPPPIKQRIMECLLLWTTEFPQNRKIREVYDMLSKEGGIEHGSGNAPAVAAKRESIFDIDEKVLSKLIQSGDPANFMRANLLIQHRVNQAARRTELLSQQKSELQEAQNTVSLLSQMLDAFEAEGVRADDNSETLTLMKDLYVACKKHKPILQHLPELIGSTDQADQELIGEILLANDILHMVMRRYKTIMRSSTSIPATPTASSAHATVDEPTAALSNVDLLELDLMGDMLLQKTVATKNETSVSLAEESAAGFVLPMKSPTAVQTGTTAPSTNLDALGDIFAMVSSAESTNASKPAGYSSLDLLEPINVFPTTSEQKCDELPKSEQSLEKRSYRELSEIDKISESLFKENLSTKGRIGSFKKDAEKITLNELAKEKWNGTSPNGTPIKAKPAKVAEPKQQFKQSEDEQMLTMGEEAVAGVAADKDDAMLAGSTDGEVMKSKNNEKQSKETTKHATAAEAAAKNALPLKHLTDIEIDLDDVTPTGVDHALLDDDDVKITLNWTQSRPSKHVSVIVISVLNKSKLPLKDFQFEASVKKPAKVRLLPPTDNAMPPHKPFRPSTPIHQVMLLLNPTGKAVDVTCIVGYKLGDDPDPIKESIVAKDIPFVE